MGVVATPELELIFDTVKTSRKYPNLKNNPRIALVIGCSTEITVQYEGIAEELVGESLAKYKKIYFANFTDGPLRESWPGITYFVVRPRWVRYCDYNPAARRIEEQKFWKTSNSNTALLKAKGAAPDFDSVKRMA